MNAAKDAISKLEAYACANPANELFDAIRDLNAHLARRDPPDFAVVEKLLDTAGRPFNRQIKVRCVNDPHDSVALRRDEWGLALHSFGLVRLDKKRASFLAEALTAYAEGRYNYFIESLETECDERGRI